MEDFRAEYVPEPPRNPSTLVKVGQFVLEIFQTVLLALVLYLLIDGVVARVRVENISMRPTLTPGEFILVNRLAYRVGEVTRGDIIVFHFPLNPQEDYIKRVIGLPGDEVIVRDGQVYVNRQPLIEEYIMAAPGYEDTWLVPQNEVFVLGDNRNQSSDSHSWGFVPFENIVGRAVVVYWPLSEIKVLSQPVIVSAAH